MSNAKQYPVERDRTVKERGFWNGLGWIGLGGLVGASIIYVTGDQFLAGFAVAWLARTAWIPAALRAQASEARHD